MLGTLRSQRAKLTLLVVFFQFWLKTKNRQTMNRINLCRKGCGYSSWWITIKVQFFICLTILLHTASLLRVMRLTGHAWSYTPQHYYTYFPHHSLHISMGTNTENLFNDHKPLKMVITSPILMFDSGVIP